MAESFIFLLSLVGTVYFLYWFWKNDDGLDDWKKKPGGQGQGDDRP
jgi:hypothetical protein